MLKNTLFIPSYRQCNLDDSAELVSPDGTKFPIVQKGRLCYLYKFASKEIRKENLSVWHKIMGHCNINDLKKLENVAESIEVKNHDEVGCETCILAKQLNIRNKSNVMKVNNPLEVIYSDLAGPIDPIGKDGFKYFINFIDEYSGCTFYYCLKQRSDAVKAAEKFITDIARYGKIKFIRTDNGGEYISEDFNSFLIQIK